MPYSYIYIIVLFFISTFAHGSNGEFVTHDHPWAEQTKAMIPIYIDHEKYEKNLLETNGKTPQANCSGTLIEKGEYMLSAAHCFQDLCEAKKSLGRKISDYFSLIDGQKISFSSVHHHPDYCRLAFELSHNERLSPNPLLPEFEKDIALIRIKDPKKVRGMVFQFPTPSYEELPTNRDYVSVGYGVSDRFILFNTIWFDMDRDGVHDYWDECPDTKVVLGKLPSSNNLKHLELTNGCSIEQTPPAIPVAMNYFSATRISHKRGYVFTHFEDNDFLFEDLRINPDLFLVNHGYRGALKPVGGEQSLSFGGDSGSGFFNEDFSRVYGVLTSLSNFQKHYFKRLREGNFPPEERAREKHASFNMFLKIAPHEDFIKSVLESRED